VEAAPIRGDRRTDGKAYMTKRIGTFFATVRTRLKISSSFHVVEAAHILKQKNVVKNVQYMLRDARCVKWASVWPNASKFELTSFAPL
jgi:hypothetical protein